MQILGVFRIFTSSECCDGTGTDCFGDEIKKLQDGQRLKCSHRQWLRLQDPPSSRTMQTIACPAQYSQKGCPDKYQTAGLAVREDSES